MKKREHDSGTGLRLNRRQFLKLVGATGAVAATGSCDRPVQKLIPWVIAPEDIVPGIPVWYASACRECEALCGMLARTREGRVVKVEGNPRSTSSEGALCARGQATLQSLYNPDRHRHPVVRSGGEDKEVAWQEALDTIGTMIGDPGRDGRVVVLTGRQGPGVRSLLDRWTGELKNAGYLQYEPFQHASLRRAGEIVFGTGAVPSYDFGKAEFILSFGADFLGTWHNPVGNARGYAAFRSRGSGSFVQLESRRSLTGASADEWIGLEPGSEGLVALTMLNIMLEEGWHAPLARDDIEILRRIAGPFSPGSLPGHTGIERERLHRLTRDFAGARPGVAVSDGELVGGENATLLDAAVLLLNYAAGYTGETITYVEGDEPPVSTYRDLVALTDDMREGKVDLLIVSGLNPAYILPDALGFPEALEHVKTLVSHQVTDNETSFLADIVLPSAHFLECWDDWSSPFGMGVSQPVMRPLLDARGLGDLVLALEKATTGRESPDSFKSYIEAKWRERYVGTGGFKPFWEELLRSGGVFNEPEAREVRLSVNAAVDMPPLHEQERARAEEEHRLFVYPSVFHTDGSGANRPWLQEIPDPLTQVVWDGWVEVSEDHGTLLGIRTGDILRLSNEHGAVELPAVVTAGIVGNSIATPLGQGHSHYGRYATGVGGRVQKLLPAEAEKSSGGAVYSQVDVVVEQVGRKKKLVVVQGGNFEEDRGLLEPKHHGKPRDMYPPHPHPDYRWAMVVDLERCTGCGACVVACYAENNVPVVGTDLVSKGREMSWIRIERYFEPGGTGVNFLPMMCQHCDYAPCEPVCPVHATYHNPDGLNAQIYNRCVGTRYCSNNCPYKVRRFNWFTYRWPEPLHWQLNPDLTVREQGVMEKCTFCYQRIREARDRAKDEGRKIRDGEVTPACAQTCPTGAIVFGNIKDPESEVSKLARSRRSYRALEILNTKPSVYYLSKGGGSGHGGHA